MRSTLMDRLSSSEKFLLCFAKTGVKIPVTAIRAKKALVHCVGIGIRLGTWVK